MGRFRRIVLPGLTYHIINRGNNRDAVFLDDEDFETYLGIIYRFKKKYQFQLFAHCLMTNHVHLLLKTSDRGTISQIMQSITVAHTRHYHFKYKRCGHLWQGRFSSPIVSDDEYLLNVMQYIEQNPLRAGMVRKIDEYRWSSYRLNTKNVSGKLVDRDGNTVFQNLGRTVQERICAYRDLMQRQIDEKELENIRESIHKGSGYFSEKFKEKMKKYLPVKCQRGRPSKQNAADVEIARKLLK